MDSWQRRVVGRPRQQDGCIILFAARPVTAVPGMAFLAASRIQVTAVATTDPRVCGSTAPDAETAVEALREQSQRASGCDLSRWCFYQVSDPVQSQQTALYYNATGHHREQRAIYGNLVLWLPRLAV